MSVTFPLRGLAQPFHESRPLARVVQAIAHAGGRPFAVGGAVRDHLLGRTPKDVDVEVYGLPLAELDACLSRVGAVHAVGRSFGVLKVDVEDGDERATIDVALPRTESKTGRGHRGFVVDADPSLDFATASSRRDFTVNAMGIALGRDEPVAAALVDAHGGVADLERGILRHVSPAFDEDPLRVLRACQLAARFRFSLAEETVLRCRALAGELPTLAPERLYEEMRKLLLADHPAIGLAFLVDTGAISLFPELAAMRGTPQEPEWHPEGDVWVHTLMVVDEAAAIAREEALDVDERLILVVAALCHDLGKPATTAHEDGRIRSKNHESAGRAPTESFLARLRAPHALVEAVVPLVEEHLKPWQLYAARDDVSDGAVRRLAVRAPLVRLVRVARADHFGRTTPDALLRADPAGAWLLARAAALAVEDAAPTPLLMGRHLLALGLAAGPALGPILKRAFDAQLDGRFIDEEGAIAWARAHLAERV